MPKKQKKIAVSGYFIWLHKGHIDYFKKAKKLGGELIAIINNDEQQILKYGKIIIPLKERTEIVKAIQDVDKTVTSIDKDSSVCKTLAKIKPDIFANGGDRTKKNIPETEICNRLGIKIVDNLGNKINSASRLIQENEDNNSQFLD